ncbi:hypothetical protein ZIOFF_033412 [Zingiber officinale]|uniref:NAD-dependent protein deacylase n=1 Tax=Zingiber officinale TaxID=94328 RepID=A0A8J5LCK4_ZINOF|nr:hypothetical protein ZIOFF_033412 [Zingiber officinale]
MKTAAHRHAAALVESLQEAIGSLSKGSSLHMSTVQSTLMHGSLYTRRRESVSKCCISQLLTSSSYSTYRPTLKDNNVSRFQNLNKRKIVPHSDPPSAGDVNLLNDFIDQSHKLMVLTGAGISTESGIPDYRSPNGAYSTGFKPITHQEFVRSIRARRRYWARSYAGWIKFISAQPNAAHHALSSLEKIGRIYYMVTQNVDRLHHRAGSNPLELHGTVYTVVCLECGNSINRDSFQDRLKSLNPKSLRGSASSFCTLGICLIAICQSLCHHSGIAFTHLSKNHEKGQWAASIESLESGNPGSDKSFGMHQRPDADIEIDAKYWEEDFEIPNCQLCGGMLKPDVVFFGDNVPKERADKAREAARECDSFLVIGSSVMTMSAFRLVRAAHEAGAPVAVVNIGETRADDFVSVKINARCGETPSRFDRYADVASLIDRTLFGRLEDVDVSSSLIHFDNGFDTDRCDDVVRSSLSEAFSRPTIANMASDLNRFDNDYG